VIVAIVRFDLPNPLSLDEARHAFEASAPSYESIPGLLRKHYLISDDGRVGGGVYLWESRQHAEATYNDSWRDRLTARYGAPPRVEYFYSPVTVNPVAS
jgi:Putative mono-oxygenase ydhR